jgi:ubiquinone/menaquinone biosynthesis C-methylase UbiE
MAEMTRFQSIFCRSAPWRFVAGRVVLPWSLQGYEPSGDVIEIGAGSGAMAAELLAHHSHVTLTVTDVDPAMVDAAAARLGARATVRQADATALPFPDESVDCVLSWVMLHHTIDWETALAECFRVLRPGGHLVGYDLLSTGPMRLVHRHDHGNVRPMSLAELRATVAALPVDQALLTPSLAGLLVRFVLRKRAPGA